MLKYNIELYAKSRLHVGSNCLDEFILFHYSWNIFKLSKLGEKIVDGNREIIIKAIQILVQTLPSPKDQYFPYYHVFMPKAISGNKTNCCYRSNLYVFFTSFSQLIQIKNSDDEKLLIPFVEEFYKRAKKKFFVANDWYFLEKELGNFFIDCNDDDKYSYYELLFDISIVAFIYGEM